MSRAPIAAVAALLSGCFLVNDPSAHQPEELLPDDFCARFTEVVCGAIRDCTEGCPGAAPSPEDCEASLSVFCAAQYGPLTADGRTGYDPEAMGVEMAIGARLIQTCEPAFWTWLNERGGIDRGFLGTVDAGGSCAPVFPETPARRDAPRFASCAGEALCVLPETDGDWTCLEPVGEGEECLRRGCAEGLACQPDGRCGPARAPDGGYCFEAAGCASSSCQLGGNVGVCLSTQQTFCGLVGGPDCVLENLLFAGEAPGPAVVGGRCPRLAACAYDDAQAAAMIAVAPRLECAPSPAASSCDDAGYAVTCAWVAEGSTLADPVGPEELDESEIRALCALTRISPTPADPPGEALFPPLVVCADL